MGFLQNLVPQWMSGLGEKVKNAAKSGVEWFGKAKGLFEMGKTIYNGARAIMPYIEEAATAIPYLL